MKLLKIVVVLFGLVFGVSSFAADPEPLAMLKNTSAQMLGELNKHIGQLKNNDKLVYNLVNRVLLPNFDLTSMSRAVVGRDYWQQAATDTQQQFIKEFTCYVIRTYSAALQTYDGEKIKFYPMRGAVTDNAQVNSDLMLKSGPPIQMQYRLLKQGGKWLIYDFSVDGVSIIKNYNSQFAGVLRKGGLTLLVQQLRNSNARR